MKKYFFEARITQHEKPTEPKQFLCAPAKTFVFADDDEAAKKLAAAKLRNEFYGTGYLLGELKITKITDLPVDWQYGYDDDRKAGTEEEKKALRADCTK